MNLGIHFARVFTEPSNAVGKSSECRGRGGAGIEVVGKESILRAH